MKTTTLLQHIAILALIVSPVMVFAQGDSTGSGTGSTGGTGAGSSSGSSGSSMASSVSTETSAFDETVETPTYQGLQDNSNRGFIGSGSPDGFVGVDEIYDSFAPTNSTTNRAATTTTRRTTTATRSTARTSANRNLTSRTSSNSTQLVRSSAVTDFDYVRPQPAQRILALQQQLKPLRGLQDESLQIASTKSGTVVTLTGTVSSEKERKLAKQLLLLEPGIDKVENNLTVKPSKD